MSYSESACPKTPEYRFSDPVSKKSVKNNFGPPNWNSAEKAENLQLWRAVSRRPGRLSRYGKNFAQEVEGALSIGTCLVRKAREQFGYCDMMICKNIF